MRNSLVGLLQHATKVVRSRRTFVAQMHQTTAKLKKLNYFTRLTKSDLYLWHTFITSWNGMCILCRADCRHVNFSIQTDASGSWGCRAYWDKR